ncbi:diguanylate cyclase domain-containing protein [Roseateles sp. BYS180W]|uniref:Diguanylate cyclase domain-containing protein n=1 Tax=Roseateles rivi TaxID=3299028 RepID=A0ABW7FTL6_9BURK
MSLLALSSWQLGLALSTPGLAMSWWLPAAVLALVLALGAAAIGTAVQARAAIAQSQRMLKEVLDALPVGVELFDAQDQLLAYNHQVVALFPYMASAFARGGSFEALLRESLRQGCVPEAKGREEAWLAQRLRERQLMSQRMQQQSSQDSGVRLHEQRTASGFIVSVRSDVSDLVREQRRLQQCQAQLDALCRTLPQGVLMLDERLRVRQSNAQAQVLLGHSGPAMAGQHLMTVLASQLMLTRDALIRAPQELVLKHTGGEQKIVTASLVPLPDEEAPVRHLCIVTDISEQRQQAHAVAQLNTQLTRQSSVDDLTGVGSRQQLEQTLRQEWLRAARNARPQALLLIELNDFAAYIQHYGQAGADTCLQRVARLLQASAARSGEVVSRYSEHQFAILLPDTLLVGAHIVAQRCVDSLRLAQIEHQGTSAGCITLSVGVTALVPDARQSHTLLIDTAEAALTRVKENRPPQPHDMLQTLEPSC